MVKQIKSLLPENSRRYREETSQRILWGHWFTLFNIVLALLISSRYAFNADWPNTLLGKLYFFLSLFGHFSFTITAFALLLLFPLSFLIKNNRAFRGISVIIATAGISILLLDSEVFKRFYLHLSPLVWDLLVNPDEGELARQWQLLFVPMPLILLLEMLYSRWCWHKLRSFERQKWGRKVAAFFILCFISTHLFYAAADIATYRPITAQKANYPLSYPMTARSFLEKHGLIDRDSFDHTIATSGRLDTFFLNYPKKSLSFVEPQQKINFLFLNLSGINHTISAQSSPMLWQISQQSRYFTQHYSGGNTSSAGIVSLFYGLSGRYVDAILNEKQPAVLISRLQALNYQFGLFSHNHFAEAIYRQSLFQDFELPKAENSQVALTQWQKWLKQQKHQPFFSYLSLDGSQSEKLLDQQLTQIWQALTEQHLTHNTLVLITSDQADAPTSHNGWQTTKVPMLLYWQGEHGHYGQLSSHLDIAPTIINQFLGGISPTEYYAQGIDLTKENSRKWVLIANYRWNVAQMPTGEQYHLDRKGDFIYYNAKGEKASHSRPPLALFLHLIQQSNQFVEK